MSTGLREETGGLANEAYISIPIVSLKQQLGGLKTAKLNQDKYHLLISEHIHETVWAKIGETKIWKSNNQKLLGVVFEFR